jgi:hypothetical protein
MKDKLARAYKSRLLSLFSETRSHMAKHEFGAEKSIIATTIPLMVLENWREISTSNNIPLLDEAIKNTILGCAAVMFGWEKTAYLHLRVVLENVLNGVYLAQDSRKYRQFLRNGVIQYTKLTNLINTLISINKCSMQLEAEFELKKHVIDLYETLSFWNHSLGSEYVSDLQVLGRQKLSYAKIKLLRDNFKTTCRIAAIFYLHCRPDILSMISTFNQRLLLVNFSIPERERIRNILNV